MIYTLTLNPAIDYVVGVDSLNEGKINKVARENVYAGGKGINVSTVLKNLNLESVALGFIAGATGRMLEDMLRIQGINTDFVVLPSGMTRINVKLSDSKKETEINGRGPIIDEAALTCLYDKLANIGDEDILIMSGSIPGTMPESALSDICSFFRKRNCIAKIIVDTSSKAMLSTLEYNPVLVKPNNHELGAMFGVEITNFEDARKYALKLKDMGAKNVLVSMGSQGALLIDENGGCHRTSAPTGKVINSVGAGDTTVGAFAALLASGDVIDYDMAVRYCVAAGSATAFSEGLADREMIEKIYNSMK